MHRIGWFTFALVLAVAAVASRPALAWSERSDLATPYGGSNFTDPDQRIERMTGRSEDGERGRTSSSFGNSGGSGWSFTMSPPQTSTSSSSPFNSMLFPGWSDRRR